MGGPADAELLPAGTQCQKYPRIITDDGLRRAPPCNRLAANLHDTGEVLAIETARAHNGPAVPVEQEDTVEPVLLELDQVAHIDEPDLMGSLGGLWTLVWIQ